MEISGCDFIDINMGCPMAKVVSNGDGSALMKDIPLAARIVEAVAHAVPVPVTVKCRLGWDRGSINVVELAQAVRPPAPRPLRSMAGPGPCSIPVWQTGTPSEGQNRSLHSGDCQWGCFFPERRRCNAKSGLERISSCWAGESLGIPGFFRRWPPPWPGKLLLPGHPWPAGLTQRWSSFCLAEQDKGSTLPAWKRASTLPGTFGAYPTAAIIREKISHISTMADILDIAAGVKRDLR